MRRNYPQTSSFTQGDVAVLLAVGSKAVPKQGALKAGDEGVKQLVELKESTETVSLAQVFSNQQQGQSSIESLLRSDGLPPVPAPMTGHPSVVQYELIPEIEQTYGEECVSYFSLLFVVNPALQGPDSNSALLFFRSPPLAIPADHSSKRRIERCPLCPVISLPLLLLLFCAGLSFDLVSFLLGFLLCFSFSLLPPHFASNSRVCFFPFCCPAPCQRRYLMTSRPRGVDNVRLLDGKSLIPRNRPFPFTPVLCFHESLCELAISFFVFYFLQHLPAVMGRELSVCTICQRTVWEPVVTREREREIDDVCDELFLTADLAPDTNFPDQLITRVDIPKADDGMAQLGVHRRE